MEFVARLKSTLPKGSANSLADVAQELYKTPLQVRVGIVLFGVHHTTDRPHDEVGEAHVQIVRFEHIVDPDLAFSLREMLRTIYQNRTGEQQLPPELMADEENAFATDFLRHGSGVFHGDGRRLVSDDRDETDVD